MQLRLAAHNSVLLVLLLLPAAEPLDPTAAGCAGSLGNATLHDQTDLNHNGAQVCCFVPEAAPLHFAPAVATAAAHDRQCSERSSIPKKLPGTMTDEHNWSVENSQKHAPSTADGDVHCSICVVLLSVSLVQGLLISSVDRVGWFYKHKLLRNICASGRPTWDHEHSSFAPSGMFASILAGRSINVVIMKIKVLWEVL